MADQIYLNLWLESFSEETMLEAWGKLLEAFPASTAQPGIRGFAAIPFSWGESAVLEQVFPEGATTESTLAAAGEFSHADYAYQAAMHWDVWRQKTVEELAETDLEALAAADLASDEEAPPDEEAAWQGEGAAVPPSTDAVNETLGWKRVPMEVTITCLGPEFDRFLAPGAGAVAAEPEPSAGANPHFRIELGLDTLFLPDVDQADSDVLDEEDWEEAALCYRDNIAQLLGFMRRIEKTLPLRSRLLWSASGEDLSERIRQAYSGG